MDSSTRLYARLAQIPSDPSDPESLDDLLVCAFGAFERFYLCWRTKGGEYRQDGHDLPPALRDWLYPPDESTRDFATLQVVFGRGEEYFASDKDGKLEYKEPASEPKKTVALEDDDKMSERQALRRSRTVSFLRPLSETLSVRSGENSSTIDDRASRRSESISSQRLSRPPSLSYSSRTNSELSMYASSAAALYGGSSGGVNRISGSSMLSTWTAPGGEEPDDNAEEARQEKEETSLVMLRKPTTTATTTTTACSCGCHDAPPPQPSSPHQREKSTTTYTDSSTQTEVASPPLPPSRTTALRIDTAVSTYRQQPSSYSDSVAIYDVQTPPILQSNPVFMGRMMDYFSKPGYQLGDSLSSGYHDYQPQPTTYQYTYQDEFGPEALR